MVVCDKGAMVALPYGIEAFAPSRQLFKEDGSHAKVDEALDFKVLEFSKDNKKIVVSHTKIQQDINYAGERQKNDFELKKKDRDQNKSGRNSNDNLEKATFGDIDALSNLKTEMQNIEKEKLEAMAKRTRTKEAPIETPEPQEQPEQTEQPTQQEETKEETAE